MVNSQEFSDQFSIPLIFYLCGQKTAVAAAVGWQLMDLEPAPRAGLMHQILWLNLSIILNRYPDETKNDLKYGKETLPVLGNPLRLFGKSLHSLTHAYPVNTG